MYQNVAVNWNVFQYNFSGNPRDAFENLSYILFCYEFNQKFGVFRYFNQPHIETLPVKIGDNCIGFQAKYFDESTQLATKKKELKDAIDGAKLKYPGINKIIFYVNKELSSSTKKGKSKPDYQIEIEKHGTRFAISVEWRVKSNFEAMLLKPDLDSIRDFFFNPQKGIKGYLSQVNLHSKSILNSIKSEIKYERKVIKNKSTFVDFSSFYTSQESCLIIYGDGGSGKSGLVKDYFEKVHSNEPIIAFKVTDFDVPSLSEFSRKFGEYTFEDFLMLFNDIDNKTCLIDSVEKVFTMNNQNLISEEVLNLLIKYGWKIIFTVRTIYKDNFINSFLSGLEYQEYEVKTLEINELIKMVKDTDLILPKDIKMKKLLCNLFYLKLYIEILPKNENNDDSIEKFIERIWNYKIKDISKMINSLHTRREEMICSIVLLNANSGTSYYVPRLGDDYNAINALMEDEIIAYDTIMNGYYLCHDIYEELVLKHIIQTRYKNSINCHEFFVDIGDSLIVRKIFRLWIKDTILTVDRNITDFITRTLYADDVESIWKDELLIALMGIKNETDSFSLIERILNKDDYILLFRAVFLLNTTCRVVNIPFWKQILTTEEREKQNLYRVTMPTGSGWQFIFKYIFDNRNLIPWEPKTIMVIVDTLHAWVSHKEKGNVTRYAGLIALFLYEKVKTEQKLRYVIQDEKLNKINSVILLSAIEIRTELATIIKEVIDTPIISHMDKYYDLCTQILGDLFNCGNICKADPELVIALSKKYWFYKDNKTNFHFSNRDLEDAFGINNKITNEYNPSSAYQTPIFALLQADPSKTLDFIIELFDHVTSEYYESYLEKDYSECSLLNIYLPNGKEKKQIVSSRLWQMHRGTYPAPDLLESILMALERWLFFIVKEAPEHAKIICLKLLSSSQSAALTSVVISMVSAYPEELFEIACILIYTKEIFLFDNSRYSAESSANFLKGTIPRYEIFDKERIASNNLLFRKKKFEDVIIDYQINRGALSTEEHEERVIKLHNHFDSIFENIEMIDPIYQFPYYQMDLRKHKLDTEHIVEKDGNTYVPLIVDLPINLEEIQKMKTDKHPMMFENIELLLWSKKRFEKHKNEYKKYTNYESDPLYALIRAKDIWENNSKEEYTFIEKSTSIYVFTVLIRDFKELLSKDEFDYCKDVLIKYVYSKIEKDSLYQAGDGLEAAIAALPLLANYEEYQNEISFENPLILIFTLILGRGKTRQIAVQNFSSQMWSKSFEFTSRVYLAFLKLKPKYDVDVLSDNRISAINFIEKNKDQIRTIIINDTIKSIEFSILDVDTLMTASLLLPLEGDFSVEMVLSIGHIIWGDLFSEDYHKKHKMDRNYELEHSYISWLANFALELSYDKQQKVLKELCKYLKVCDNSEQLFKEILFIQDRIQKYDSFWRIWYMFHETIVHLCKEREEIDRDTNKESTYYRGDLNNLVVTYLLAFEWWNKNIQSWHTLKKENGSFFHRLVSEIGYNPSVIYAISRVLNTIGYDFLLQGVDWLYEIIQNNPHLEHKSLQINSEYYIEEYMQRYITQNKSEFKKNPSLRNKVITILSFLVNRGSTCGYMLREEIV